MSPTAGPTPMSTRSWRWKRFNAGDSIARRIKCPDLTDIRLFQCHAVLNFSTTNRTVFLVPLQRIANRFFTLSKLD